MSVTTTPGPRKSAAWTPRHACIAAIAAILAPTAAPAFSVLPPSRALSFVDTPFFGPGARTGGTAAPDPLSGLTFGLNRPGGEPCGAVPVPADLRRWEVDLPIGTLVEFAQAGSRGGLGWLYEYAAARAVESKDPLNHVAVRLPAPTDPDVSIWRTAPVELEVAPAREAAAAGLFPGMDVLIDPSNAGADVVRTGLADLPGPSSDGVIDPVAPGSFVVPRAAADGNDGRVSATEDGTAIIASDEPPRWTITIDLPQDTGVGIRQRLGLS